MASSSTDGLLIEASPTIEPLGEIIGMLRKREHPKEFLAKIFEQRDKQLFPKDLLVASFPTRKGGRRAAGMLKRSLKFDAKRGCHVCIDFVWVAPDFRRRGLGRGLLMAGLRAGSKDKPVRLLVAGSENNYRAVGLYESLGFRWVSSLMTDMVLAAEQVTALMAAEQAKSAGGDEADAESGEADEAERRQRRDERQSDGHWADEDEPEEAEPMREVPDRAQTPPMQVDYTSAGISESRPEAMP